MQTIQAALEEAINSKTKPPGALGRLEEIALQVGLIQQTTSPVISKSHIVVFAADHGIAAEGLVNPYPQAVTAQMVLNFLAGGAAINVFCRQHHIQLTVVDAGVNAEFDTSLPLIHGKLGYGTANYANGKAITASQLADAMQKGAAIVADIYTGGCNTIGFGEMGIGNTSSAALIMHQLCKQPLENCTGLGTGTNQQQYQLKLATLQKAASLHGLGNTDISTDELLQCIGGFEIAMMAGAYLKAFALGMVIVVDGFISTAALLAAHTYNNQILSHCIFAHTSGEKGHQLMLQYLQVQPLLQLGMRLGEGTGAALAIPLIQSAVNFLNEMASFKSAGINNKAV